MPFITRCPNCLTAYRVVDDQLRLAGGWVRCGRCSEMFNAAQARVDLEEPERQRASGAAAQPGLEAAPAAARSGAGTPADRAAALARAASGPTAGATPPPEADQPAAKPDGPPVAEPRPPLGTSVAMAAPALPALDSDDVARGRRLLGSHALPPDHRRQRPGVRQAAHRWIWGGVAALSTAALGAQALVAWHDQLAQSMPALKPVVEVVCVMVDCRVEAARQLQALSVESSELVQLGGTVYQVTLVLRSRADQELAVPAIDLKLTNARQEVVIRRVLRLSDFGLRGSSIGPRREFTLQAALSTGERQIAGYNIELFYP
jgi:predicted Zn finger-like uncharacterized protein